MMKQIQYRSRNYNIYGFLHLPDTSRRVPALVLCHGFTGSGYESSRLFVEFAKRACEQEIAVLRIDFLGSGNSDADFAEHTYLSGWVEDVLSGVKFLSQQEEIDGTRIGVLGISFGACAAMIAGGNDQIRAIGGWASVIYPENTFRGILSEENWNYLAQSVEHRIKHIYAGAHFELTGRFVDDLQHVSIPDAVAAYRDKPLLLMQGDLDTVIDTTHSAKLAGISPGIEYHYIKGEDHSFLCHRDENIETTLEFFKRNL